MKQLPDNDLLLIFYISAKQFDNGSEVCYFMINNYLLLKTTGDFMIKRLLFILSLVGFVISVPHDVFAAPKKETKKERRERLRREKAARERRQKTPPQDRYSESLEKCLEKSQLTEKEKSFLADAIKEIKNTAVGKKIIFQMNNQYDFKFAFKPMQQYTWGSYGKGAINLNSTFLTYKDENDRKMNLIYCASVMVHEMTHALHRRYNIRLIEKNPTWIARIQDIKLRELHCKITQTEIATELARKYKYLGYFDKPSESRVVDESKTWNKIIEAKMQEGASYTEANRFAREKIAQHLWMNKYYDLVIGNTKIPLDMAWCWDVSYGASAMRWESPEQGKNRLNEKDAAKILLWMDAGIGIRWMKENFSYRIENNILIEHHVSPLFGKGKSEYIICHGFTIHRCYYYDKRNGHHYDGKLKSIEYIFRKVPGKRLKKDGTFVVKFPNGRKQAEYTVADGRLHGFYKEWDSQGKLLFKVPFTKDNFIYPDGEGIITENGKQLQATFHGKNLKYILELIKRQCLKCGKISVKTYKKAICCDTQEEELL